MGKHTIDNAKNYGRYKNWICGHFLPDEFIQKNSDFEVKYSQREPGGGIREEVLEVVRPTRVITVRVPSLPNNKVYK